MKSEVFEVTRFLVILLYITVELEGVLLYFTLSKQKQYLLSKMSMYFLNGLGLLNSLYQQ